MRFASLITTVLLLAACVPTTALPPTKPGGPEGLARPTSAAAEAGAMKARNFLSVVATVEPVAEKLCRQRGVARNCDFRIVIDDRAGQPPNAFQTLDSNGRPIIGFTLALIAEARNTDELAFVLGHEAGHHIAGHIPKSRDAIMTDALMAGLQTKADGGSKEEVQAAQNRAAAATYRSFSMAYELEADALGAEIAFIAGYDAVHGAGFFDHLPEPGNGFLSTHPANSRRKAVVRATVARLGG